MYNKKQNGKLSWKDKQVNFASSVLCLPFRHLMHNCSGQNKHASHCNTHHNAHWQNISIHYQQFLIHFYDHTIKSRNSSVGIVVRIQPWREEAMVCLWPTQSPVQQVQETLSPGIKQPAYKADHPQPPTANVKIRFNSTTTPN